MKVFDMHCDTIMALCIAKKNKLDLNLRQNDLMVSLEKLNQGDCLAQCFAMFVPYTVDNPFETCMEMIDRYYLEIEANKDLISPVLTYQDILKNQQEGKISAILTIEEGGVIKNNLSFLRDFYRLGVRMITLTWNYENGIGYPNYGKFIDGKPDYLTPDTKNGLTPFGIEMIKEMNELGIIIDVSHLSDAGFYDVCEYSTKPFVASHSNARNICSHVRNLSDDMIIKLAQKGGVMGINYCADFVNDNIGTPNFAYIKDLVKHIKHIVKVGGIDCVGLGSDFDGIPDNIEMNDASKLSLLEKALKEEGFTTEEIEKIFYKNVLRVFAEVLK